MPRFRHPRRAGLLLLLLPSLNAAELPSELFPGLDAKDPEMVRLRGIAALYPGRVRFEAPQTGPANRRSKAASVADLSGDIRYIRLYRLGEGLASVRENIGHSALILDFRYLRSRQSGAALAALLGGSGDAPGPKPAGTVPDNLRNQLQAAHTAGETRRHPVVVLTNGETAGPFEAVLPDLQTSGAVIGVGSATAGDTGFFREIRQGVWVLEGELRTPSGASVIPGGFRPRVTTGTGPEADYRAYHLREAGTPLAHLTGGPAATTDAAENGTAADTGPNGGTRANGESGAITRDAVLKRGIETVKALRILERLPD